MDYYVTLGAYTPIKIVDTLLYQLRISKSIDDDVYKIVIYSRFNDQLILKGAEFMTKEKLQRFYSEINL